MLGAHSSRYPMGIHYSPCILMPQKKGRGAVCKGDKARGQWNVTESNCHINELETLAFFLFALKSLCHSMTNCHLNTYIDNTTTVSYINGWHSLFEM